MEELCNVEEQNECDQMKVHDWIVNVTVNSKKVQKITDEEDKKIKKKPLKQQTLLDWGNQSGRKSKHNTDSLPGVGVDEPEVVDIGHGAVHQGVQLRDDPVLWQERG